MSEALGTPVLIRITTRLAESPCCLVSGDDAVTEYYAFNLGSTSRPKASIQAAW